MDTQLYMQLFLVAFILSSVIIKGCNAMSKNEKKALRDKVLEMFYHGYNNYMDKAFPLDELMPISCRGRGRGTEASRGDIDDTLGNFSLTLVDTLDTLVVLGELEEFENAVNLVISEVSFDTDVVVSVFETNIRVLGGLLGGHTMASLLKKKNKGMASYNDELLYLAKDLGYRLLPAFNTSTGIPYPRVNLRYGVKDSRSRTGSEKDTCTSCAGTMILEFSALSRMTGIPTFEQAAEKAMTALWKSRHRGSDLVGTVINIHNGDWVRRESGVGAGIDSYYEYLLKAYILLGEESYLDRFNKHYRAVMKYISNGPMMVDVHMHRPLTNSRNFMDALLAFWPGLQVLKGDIKPAIETHEMLYQITQRHNFLPEAFTTDFRVHWGQHPLRPEFIESTYFIYKATGDPHYLDVGRTVLENLEKHAKVPCGFAAIKDVTTMEHEDQMDSYVLAETFKYLYLLFAEKDDLVIDIDSYLFTTEAHLLPLSLSMNDSKLNLTKNEGMFVHHGGDDDDYERSCPNTNHMFKGNKNFAQNLRIPLKNFVDKICPKPRIGSRKPRLRASDFMAGNKDQLAQLGKMGIRIVTMPDGRVQLLHTAAEATSNEDAEDGMLFMQEMIELSKTQAQEVQQEPRLVQLLSPPHLGTTHLSAGPAQFGLDLKTVDGVYGRLAVAQPYRACQALVNPEGVKDRIVIMERGDCMFIDKARILQAEGAIGGIVIDNAVGSSSRTMPLFAMSGDGKSEVSVPMLFLFHQEGVRLLEAFGKNNELWVRLGHKPIPGEEVTKILRSLHVNVEAATIEITTKTLSNDPVPEVQLAGQGDGKRRSVIEDIEQTRDMLKELMNKLNVGADVNIRVRSKTPGSAGSGGRTAKGPDNIQQVQIPAEQFLGKNEQSGEVFKDMMTLLHGDEASERSGPQKQYLDAVKKLIHAALQSDKGVFGGNLQERLDRLNEEIKEKYSIGQDKEEGVSELEEDNEPEESAPLDNLTKNLNEALDIYVDAQLNMVLDEAKEGLDDDDYSESPREQTLDGLAKQADPVSDQAPISSNVQTPELTSFATAEELEEADQSKRDSRYNPPSVQKAPDWMNLDEGQIFIDQDGNIFVKDGPEDIESHLDLEGEASRYPEDTSEESVSKLDYAQIKNNLFAQQEVSSQNSVKESSAGSEDIESDTFEIPKIKMDIKSLTPVDDSLDSDDITSDESAKASAERGSEDQIQGSTNSLNQDRNSQEKADSLPHRTSDDAPPPTAEKDEL